MEPVEGSKEKGKKDKGKKDKTKDGSSEVGIGKDQPSKDADKAKKTHIRPQPASAQPSEFSRRLATIYSMMFPAPNKDGQVANARSWDDVKAKLQEKHVDESLTQPAKVRLLDLLARTARVNEIKRGSRSKQEHNLRQLMVQSSNKAFVQTAEIPYSMAQIK